MRITNAPTVLAPLRVAEWLTANRARAWCRLLAVMVGVMVLASVVTAHHGIDRLGKPLGTDFVSFWTASQLALSGHPTAAYDPVIHQAAQRSLFPSAAGGYVAFFYPPTFLLLCLPLAALPYLPALAAWLAAGLVALITCLRRLLPERWAIFPILVFPGLLANAGHGQNGFVTSACLGWSMLLSNRRPFVAGMCLGLLVIKPHLLLVAPVALLAARRWAMLAGAVTSGLGLIAASWIVLGDAAWHGFLAVAPLARVTLEQGFVEPWKMTSVFAAVRLLHGSLDLAYTLQAIVAVSICIVVARCAVRRPGALAEGALLVAAIPLCTPFLLDYDLVCLALPIAFVAAEAQRTGWQPWEKIVLLAAYILPLAARPVAMGTGVPVAPLVILSLLLVVARRATAPEPVRDGAADLGSLGNPQVATA
jgi:hypothetical protein